MPCLYQKAKDKTRRHSQPTYKIDSQFNWQIQIIQFIIIFLNITRFINNITKGTTSLIIRQTRYQCNSII